jgi:hypothetical protein
MTRTFLLTAFILGLLAVPAARPARAADFDHPAANPSQPYAAPSCAGGGPVGVWTVKPDDDLQKTLDQWAHRSGWHIQWQSQYNFTIGGPATFRTRFTSAVGALLSAMQEARPSPVADVWRDNCVIVISDGLTSAR